MREALCDLLQVTGHAARAYADAAAFLQDHAPGRFGLLVTDVRMPQMDGIELLRRAKAADPVLPAIAITSSADPETCARAIEEGALACLSKPVDDRTLLGLIDTALGRNRKEPPGG